jgi:predicted MPP superfamily phosphohydrolase
MIPDRSGLLLAAALVLIIGGNLWHFVWAVNISSGLGYSEKTLSRLRLVFLLILMTTTILIAWYLLRVSGSEWPWPVKLYGAICIASSVLIGPLGSLCLRLRRPIAGSPRQSLHSNFTESQDARSFIGDTWKAQLLRIPGNRSLHLRRVEWDLEFPGLHQGLNGLSIVQLSDLHFARCYQRTYFDAVVDSCREWPADLVLITGDIVDDLEMIDWIEPILGRLEARHGKFAILGNHDYEHAPELILSALERAGFTTLEGRWSTLKLEGAILAVGGTSAPWGPEFEVGDIPKADFHVLLSHTPDQFAKARRWGMDFVLSGHNHGGQIRLPLIGPLFMPSLYSRRFDRGFFRSGSTLLYVSEGIGGKHPVRFGCTPEVARFVLRHACRTPSDHYII